MENSQILRNIFVKNDKHELDLSLWTKYGEKKDFEKELFSEYYKRKIVEDDNHVELSVGVFRKLTDINTIWYVAWGYRGQKDCSYHATVTDNKYLNCVVSGCFNG